MQSAKSILTFVQKITFIEMILDLYKDSFFKYADNRDAGLELSSLCGFSCLNNGISFAIFICLGKWL